VNLLSWPARRLAESQLFTVVSRLVAQRPTVDPPSLQELREGEFSIARRCPAPQRVQGRLAGGAHPVDDPPVALPDVNLHLGTSFLSGYQKSPVARFDLLTKGLKGHSRLPAPRRAWDRQVKGEGLAAAKRLLLGPKPSPSVA
jgi:hypothetical protein